MPNWVTNEVYVDGSKKELKRFVEYIQGTDEEADDYDFSFEKIAPTPKELMDRTSNFKPKKDWTDEDYKMVEKYGAIDWYYWRINDDNWGTKWHAGELHADIHDKGCYFNFQTAWSPPIGIWRRLKREFPKLKFHWEHRDEDPYGWRGTLQESNIACKPWECDCLDDMMTGEK